MSKLKNIKALKEMLAGEHRSQRKTVVGFSDAKSSAEKSKRREVGEIWSEHDIHGNEVWFRQEQGYRMRFNVHPEISDMYTEMRVKQNSFPNCPKDVCTCKSPTRLDEKFRKKVGMCEDCLISMETSLKMKGKFNEYAINKMKANAESFFKDADVEVEILKKEISNINFAGDENDVNPIENWSFQDSKSFKEFIDEKYREFKENTLQQIEQKRGVR